MLSKAIIEMHGGVIGATSQGEGKGCTCFLELPIYHIYDGNYDSSSKPTYCNTPLGLSTSSSKSQIISTALSFEDNFGEGERNASPVTTRDETGFSSKCGDR